MIDQTGKKMGWLMRLSVRFLGLWLVMAVVMGTPVWAEPGPMTSIIASAVSGPVVTESSTRSSNQPTDTVPLQLNSQGKLVRQLQTKLQQLDYFRGPVDGWYGQDTQQAVTAFQRKAGLLPDGIAGSKTLETLRIPRAQPPSSASRPKMPPDIQRILDRGTLVVAVLGQDNPPFFMPGRGSELNGLDVKLAKAIAEALGVDLEINRTALTFDEVVKSVYQLDADLAISKISRTLKRAKTVRFSRPYLNMRQGLLVNRLQIVEQADGRNMTEMVRQLKGKVGVIKGSSYVGFTKQKFPNATIVEFPAWSDVVEAVIQGKVLAAYRDELEVKKIVLSKPDAALQFQTIALTDTQDSIAIATPWDSGHLLAFVNQYLDSANIDYTADTLLNEYSDYFKVSTSPKKGKG